MKIKAHLRPYYKGIQWACIRIYIKIFRLEGIVILGCGRSGTRFSSKYLTQRGFRVGHEGLKYNGISSWFLTASDSKVPTGPEFKMVRDLGFNIIHQVREPLASISSMQTIRKSNWQFIATQIPVDLDADSIVLRAMKYWFYWNKKAEMLTDKRVRVEHFQTEIGPYIRRKLKSPGEEKKISGKDRINSRKHSSLTWEDLDREDAELTRKIKEMAARYGYAARHGPGRSWTSPANLDS